jgi:glutamine synthetase
VVRTALDAGPAAFGVYEGEGWETIPLSLGEALDALEADSYIRSKLGEQFVQAFVAIKRNEVRRFSLAVTDWEINEYLEDL